MPLVIIVALTLGSLSGGGPDSHQNPTSGVLPPVVVSAPPHAEAEAAPCAKVLAQLPVQLGNLDPRVVHTTPPTPNVVAWGDPAIVLACGVDRPKDLHPGSSAQYFSNRGGAGPFYDVTRSGNANVYTTVDRAAYVSITIPAAYQAARPLSTLLAAIGKALPAVCVVNANEPNPDKLCTRRK